MEKIFSFARKHHSYVLPFLVIATGILAALILRPITGVLAAKTDASPNEIIVKYKVNVTDAEKNGIHSRLQARLEKKLSKLNLDILKVPQTERDIILQALRHNPSVEYAELNYKAKAFSVTNDSSLSQQWGLFKIDAANSATTSAWDVTQGSPTVKIAILDTGIDESHPDLSGKVVAHANFTDSTTVLDENGHGSHVAGIAAAVTNNSTGVAGTSYNTSLLSGKVLSADGSGYYTWIVNGIVWAADQGANVISMSLGGSSPSQALQDAIDYAWSKGTVVVVAAGNSGSSSPSYPAYYPNAIAVAATDSNDAKASWSNYGSWVDVAAPGVSIYSTYKNSSYATLSGTSMATPFAAGEAALIWAAGLCSTNACVRSQLEQTADSIPGTGSNWIWGRINAYRAVSTLASATPTATPTSAPTPTATPTPTPIPTMTASDIAMSYTVLSGTYRRINTTVTVMNESTSAPLPSATVKMQLKTPSGAVYSYSGTTNTSGKVTFRRRTKEKGTFTATITSITRSGYIYHPTLTSKSLLVQ